MKWKTCEHHEIKFRGGKGAKCCCCMYERTVEDLLKENQQLRDDVINLNTKLLSEKNKGLRLQEKYKANLYQIPF